VENQNIEWKEFWKDEYLRHICAFANAQGGLIEVGRNNAGTVVGFSETEKLFEELPNKVRNSMGIIVDVNLAESGILQYVRGAQTHRNKPQWAVDCLGIEQFR